MSDERRLTRRQLAGVLGGGLLACRVVDAGSQPLPRRPGVVGVAKVAAPDGPLDAVAARRALDAALAAATGIADAAAAASRLFSRSDTVGIKLNCLSGRGLSPRRELVEALVEMLLAAGVAGERIVVFDRSSRELERAGFAVRRTGGRYLCYGIDNEYEAQPSISGSIGSCFARLVVDRCTALIGFGVVKDHDLCGVSASLKNWYGVIHNPNKYHDNNCDPYVADVVRHPYLAGKLRLTVLDGVTAQCHGGPALRPDALFPLGRVAVSTDPVAADAWAWRVVDAERQRRGLQTLEQEKRPPRFLATAARYGLGVGDRAAITEVTA